MEQRFEDGGSIKTEIVEMPSKGKAFQDVKGGGPAREFYRIDDRGNLQLWDKEGVVWVARKLD